MISMKEAIKLETKNLEIGNFVFGSSTDDDREVKGGGQGLVILT